MAAQNNMKYTGQAAFAPGFDLKPHSFAPRPFDDDYDVEIQVTHCGICGSDLHTVSGGWGAIQYPIVVGHEIIGKVVRIGRKVDATKFAVGTRVGIGAQCASCLDCSYCGREMEQLCPDMKWTYNSTIDLPNGKQYITQGGYADFFRCHNKFAFVIPDALPSEIAAPLMCAGVTTYSPLKKYNVGPGMNVGVLGIGGLGHLGIQWAVAMGATVTALSSSSKKEADCKDVLGAHAYLNYSDPAQVAAAAQSLDLILCTSYSDKTDWGMLLGLVATEGKFVLVGLPEVPISFHAFTLVPRNITFVGSIIGSPSDIEDMLLFAVEKNVRSIVQVMPMAEAAAAMQKVHAGEARFRIVLEN
ncbi:hypothetical protein DYB32_007712 [Aphanomyces invadans]|uniref:Enoyl reductase (ER) domain-containing protein n=1 Tax=Aphanomyces invadans TaxID=157072 RepID=A0A3R6YVJ3_9STRA|nr:hypothetical protein DYB32_007712 [Aphanomyces invadans]